MARIRSVKPELRTSLTVASWKREVRYAWVLLWGYLDDEGRGVDDLRLMVADMFPLDRDVTERKLNNWLTMFCEKPEDPAKPPPLCRYEVNGRTYLHATNWGEHQKPGHPTPSRIPHCPIHEDNSHDSRAAHESNQESLTGKSGASHGGLSPSRAGGAVSSEQGAVSSERATARPNTPDPFDEFWDAYPKRVAKQATRRRWDVLVKRNVDPKAIIDGAKAYAAQVRGTEAQFIKQPDGWLNAGRWEDEPTRPAEPRPPDRSASAQFAPNRHAGNPLGSALP